MNEEMVENVPNGISEVERFGRMGEVELRELKSKNGKIRVKIDVDNWFN